MAFSFPLTYNSTTGIPVSDTFDAWRQKTVAIGANLTSMYNELNTVFGDITTLSTAQTISGAKTFTSNPTISGTNPGFIITNTAPGGASIGLYNANDSFFTGNQILLGQTPTSVSIRLTPGPTPNVLFPTTVISGNFTHNPGYAATLNSPVSLTAALTMSGSGAITGGTINNTSIGATTALSGKFTTLTSTGNTNLAATSVTSLSTNNVAITGGTINGTAIGTTSPNVGVFLAVTSNGPLLVAGPTQLTEVTTTGNITTITPTSNMHVATKAYVDTATLNYVGRIKAFPEKNGGIACQPKAGWGIVDVMGQLKFWGINTSNRFAIASDAGDTVYGDSSMPNSYLPVEKLYMNESITWAITSDGYLYSSGLNDKYQQGLNPSAGTGMQRWSMSEITNVKKVIISNDWEIGNSYILTNSGILHGAGNNDFGQVGSANLTYTTPQNISSTLPTSSSGNFPNTTIVSDGVAFGSWTGTIYECGIAVIRDNGTVFVRGNGTKGQCGDSTAQATNARWKQVYRAAIYPYSAAKFAQGVGSGNPITLSSPGAGQIFTFSRTGAHGFTTGQYMRFDSNPPTGATNFTLNWWYRIVSLSDTTFKLTTPSGLDILSTAAVNASDPVIGFTIDVSELCGDRDAFGVTTSTNAVTFSTSGGSVLFAKTAHGLSEGQPIYCASSGGVASNLTDGQAYWVRYVDANNFRLYTNATLTTLHTTTATNTANVYPIFFCPSRLTNITEIYCASWDQDTTLYAIDSNRDLWSWGTNGVGQTGFTYGAGWPFMGAAYPSPGSFNLANSSSKFNCATSLWKVNQFALGKSLTGSIIVAQPYYVRNDGSLWSVGNNSVGQLGDGTTTNSSNWKELKLDSKSFNLTDQKILNVWACDSGNIAAMSVFVRWTSGDYYYSLASLGYNAHGNLSVGDLTNRTALTYVPISTRVVKNIIDCNLQVWSGGVATTKFLLNDGSVYFAGGNRYHWAGSSVERNIKSLTRVALI